LGRTRTAFLAAVGIFASLGSAFAMDKVTLVAPTKGMTMAPIFVAIDSGALKKQGIDLEVTVLSGGPPVIAALLAGNAQYATLANDALFELSHTGKVSCFYTFTNSYTQDFMVRKETLAARQVTRDLPWQERIRRLKGMTMGVLALGGAGDLAGRRLFLEAGLDFTKDMTIIRVGALSAQIASLKQGAIDGFITSSPAREIVEAGNFGEAIIRFGDIEAWREDPYEGLEALRDFLPSHQDLTRRLVAGIAEAQKMIQADPKAAADLLAKGSFSNIEVGLLESAMANTRDAFRMEKMTQARWKAAGDTRATVNPALAGIELKEGADWTNDYYPQ
jgi:ABC-type nitrate/sulfonate/bicarbonate transport system substrate-binding protein